MALKSGDRVRVFNNMPSGKRFDEGVATIIEPTGVEGQYTVRFDGDHPNDKYSRFCQDVNKITEKEAP